LAFNLPAGVASTHGLTTATQESVTARGCNIITHPQFFVGVGDLSTPAVACTEIKDSTNVSG